MSTKPGYHDGDARHALVDDAAARPAAEAGRAARGATRPARPTKPGYHHGDLRHALVDAAARLAAEVGPAAVTLREVARRAGVSQAAPYHHFADKAALLAAVAEEGFRLFDAHQAAAIDQAPPAPLERLAALGVSYLRFALEQPHYFAVMFRPRLYEGRHYPELDDVSMRAFERLVEVTRAAREASGRTDADPALAAMAMWALPHGLAGLYLDAPGHASMSAHLVEALLRAIVPALAAAPLDEVVERMRYPPKSRG